MGQEKGNELIKEEGDVKPLKLKEKEEIENKKKFNTRREKECKKRKKNT